MSNGKHVQYGEIWLVQFDPSVGHEFQKERPALVVQSDAQTRISNLITVLPLTSNLAKKLLDDIIIQKTAQNKLFSDSVIKVYNIVSFDYSRFIKKIGVAGSQTMDSVGVYLKKHFGLS